MKKGKVICNVSNDILDVIENHTYGYIICKQKKFRHNPYRVYLKSWNRFGDLYSNDKGYNQLSEELFNQTFRIFEKYLSE